MADVILLLSMTERSLVFLGSGWLTRDNKSCMLGASFLLLAC